MASVFSHLRFIRHHAAYDGITTWLRYLRWLFAICTRTTSLLRLTPYHAVVAIPPQLRGISRLVYVFRGRYEPELPMLEGLVRTGMTVVDVGAHYGTHTAVLAELVGRQGRVISLEPLPAAFALLEKTIAANGFENVDARQVAAGERDTSASLVESGDWSRTRVHEGAGPVRMCRLDSLGLSNVGFVKIDVEGAEAAVLRGATRLLEQRPALLVEMSPGSGARDLLRGLGYRIFSWENEQLVDEQFIANEVVNVVALPV